MPRRGIQIFRLILLLIGSVVFLAPLVWMVVTAVKPIDQTMTMPPKWLPTSTLAMVDGERVEVGVGKVPENANENTHVPITAAYQWVIESENQVVPVRLVEEHDNGTVTVEINYHLEVTIDNETYPVRQYDQNVISRGAGTVMASVVLPDGSVRRREIDTAKVRRLVDVTREAVGRSYSYTEQRTLPAEQVRRRYVPWNTRQKHAHVLTDNRTARLGDLDERIRPQWVNFMDAIREMKRFWTYLSNTLILCLLTVTGTAVSSAIVAYGFSRIDWPGRDKVFLFVLATMMIPVPVVMVPLYSLYRELGWIGTLKPLWVPAFFAGAFNVFLLRQFFKTIPKELSEAARIDGCSEFRIFLQIIVPLAKPAITVVALFQFLYTWNDFLGPLIYLTDEKDYTLALALQAFQSQQGGTQWHHLMAASTLVVAPIIFLFFLTQRTFIEGVSMSGLKG